MKFKNLTIATLSALALAVSASAEVLTNPQSVTDLLNRIGGEGTASKFVTKVDDTYKSSTGAEIFKISAENGKPCITGTTLSAVTTGIGWYLNHYANINVSWNDPHPTIDSLPTPAAEEEHTTTAEYRYYMNYCTFSYSMSTWTWDRWQEEIDWMALHGINMPLQIIGIEEVWRKFLMEDYGYTKDEANAFIAGPCFMAWFSMNNLEGHGGPNPDWWYERQAHLGKKMMERMHSLGMEPVLPGFYQVPSTFAGKSGLSTESTGGWCGFSRPHLPSVSDVDKLKAVGANYYKRLHEVLGESKYYSMDPFHEGGVGNSSYALELYKQLYDIMDAATSDSKWVIQQWQWNAHQKQSLNGVPKGKLIVLDLNAERAPAYTTFNGHETIFSTIYNFGARTGFDGRFQGTIDGYFNALNTASVKGVGASPEGIEQTPVQYDLLFELPWLSEKPDAAQWMAEYTKRRYGTESAAAAEAWELLRTTALNMTSSVQPPHEAVICARPALEVGKVSSWGNADIFYDRAAVIEAAYKLVEANLSGLNYSFDVTDIARQALTDYSKSLLAGLKEANSAGNTELFNKRRDALLELILDLDELLNSNKEFTLGHWTKRARQMADEVSGTTNADRDWLELNNARTIISTWSFQESGGLRDYSYREWGGMMKDYYYQRWKIWFENGMNAPKGGWFQWEWDWAHSNPDAYDDTPVGNSRELAAQFLPKYISTFTSKISDQAPIYIDRLLTNDYKKKFYDQAAPESVYAPAIDSDVKIAAITIDLNRNGLYETEERQEAATYSLDSSAPIGERNVKLELSDGTIVYYTVKILVDITDARTVSVKSADSSQGSASIVGADDTSVTNTAVVSLLATPEIGFDFDHWTDAAGNNLGNDNPYNYYGKDAAEFTANFVVNKWGVPEYNGATDGSDLSTMRSYGQYIKTMSLEQGGETTELYTANDCPTDHFIQIPTRIKAAPGSEFTFKYNAPMATGMNIMYLSAYVDLNNDGKFNVADGELLGTLGTYKSNNNTEVGTGSFTMLLPYDAELGTTHIRLRFDSSWTNQYDSTINAVPADAPTNRVIYELILDVTDYADFVSEVTVASSDTRLGTVRSENETTNLYAPGDNVILTAFPKVGTRVARWVDNHGREIPQKWTSDEGTNVNFKAYDNAHITCIFEIVPLSAGDYTLNWEPMTNDKARVTEVAGGSGTKLNLAETEVTVGAINPEAFDNIKKGIDTIILPDAEFADEKPDVFFSTQHTGDGTQNKLTQVSPTISGTESWIMYIEGSNDGSSFNQYGSSLYGNGTNCLADDYSNGWSQFYLSKDGILTIKWDCGNNGKITFDNVKLTGDFSIIAEFDASAKKLTVTASANGMTQIKEISNSTQMKDISQYATAIPKGINYTLSFAHTSGGAVIPGEIFSGFSALQDYSVKSGNSTYNVKNGIVYAKNSTKKVTGFPEGRLFIHPFTVAHEGKSIAANPQQAGDAINPESLAFSENTTNELTDKWLLEPTATDKVKLRHFNSGISASGDFSSLHTTTPGEFEYSLSYGSSFPELILGERTLTISEATKEITVTAPAKDFTLVLPAATVAPSNVTCYAVTEVSTTDGCILAKIDESIPAAEPFIVRGATPGAKLTFTLNYEMPTANTDNLLHGTTVELSCPGDYYLLNSEGQFSLKTSGNIPANSAYLLKSDLPDNIGDNFALDKQTMLINGLDTPQDAEIEIYDLQGRRVNKPGKGFYIVNGTKTTNY
ncbi:MAG: alpha-N-acetylglucosaminidase [Bacteroides sp.]|nr:alpha-N-acetylglucosaminidase [Bacteroides sp.]MCM1378864.1 alpha-N-acetylglucosaminidase [Bacteroides sp.]MCM1445480.1 alpha-N-acetylglucosaminidase [Prevotella sp.]